MDNNSISLKDIIAPAFYEVFWDILDEKHTYYDLYGGRGSTKSSFVGVMIPFLMMQDAENDGEHDCRSQEYERPVKQ